MKASYLFALLLITAAVGAGDHVSPPEPPFKFERSGKMPVTYVF